MGVEHCVGTWIKKYPVKIEKSGNLRGSIFLRFRTRWGFMLIFLKIFLIFGGVLFSHQISPVFALMSKIIPALLRALYFSEILFRRVLFF